MGWSSFKKKFTRGVKALATGGLSEVYESNKNGLDRFLGKDDRRQARSLAEQAAMDREDQRRYQEQALGIAKARRADEAAFLQQERDRYNSIYKPIEQRIGNELAAGPALEEQAGIAGSDFANSFDASVQARERDQLRQGISYRPGSSASRMQGENDAYNRARGIATAKTTARREEDDRHFLRSTAFFNSNANSIQNRLQQGMATMYGADYSARQNAAAQMGAQANQNQQFSQALNEQSYAGINTVAGLAGGVFNAIGGVGGITSGISGLSGSTAASTYTPQYGDTAVASRSGTDTPYKNIYLNDYQTNQTTPAGIGAVQSEINQGFGR